MAEIEIDDETMRVLTAEAERRGVTPAEVLASIVAGLAAPDE